MLRRLGPAPGGWQFRARIRNASGDRRPTGPYAASPSLGARPGDNPVAAMSVHQASFLIPLSLPQEPKVVPEAPTGAGTTQTPGPTGSGGAGGAGGAPAGSCADPQLMLMMGGFVALMYFMVLRPENKRRKEMAALLASIKVGDKVVTNAGLHGVVHRLEEGTVTLLVDTVKMTFDRQAIARIDRGEAAPPSK